MDDDLNTADAIGVLFDLSHTINTFVSQPRDKASLDAAKKLFDSLTGVLGLCQKKEQEEIPQEALDLLEQRQAARKEKNYKLADSIREQLKEMGYSIEDSAQGSKLKKN